MRRLGLLLAFLAVVLIGGGLVLWLTTPNIAGAVRPLIARQIESLTGRELTIAGGMTVTPSFVPTVVARQVTLKNASWGSNRPMLEVQAIEIELRLLPLLFHGEVVIDRLSLSGASLLIEESADGTLNWQNPDKPESAESDTFHAPPYLADLKIEKSSIVAHNMADDTWTTIAVDTLAWSAESPMAPLQVSAKGTIDDLPIQFAGSVGPIAQLFGGSGKWRVDLTGRIQDAAVTARGTVDLNGSATDLALTAKGERVEALGPLLDMKLPALGTYEADGQLVGTIAAPTLQAVSARIGNPATAELRVKDGRVGNLGRFTDVKLPFTLKAEDLERVGLMVGLALPPLKPLSGEAMLVRESKGYALQKLSAKAGTGSTQISVAGSVGSIAQLLGGSGKWRVDLTGRIQEAAVTARGTVDLNGAATDLTLTAMGEHVEALGPLFDMKLPALGAYEADGQLVGTIAAPTLQAASARIGNPATAELRVKDGRVGNLGRFTDVKLPFTLKAEDLEWVGRMVGLALPSLKPLSGEAMLVRESKGYALQELSAKAGTGSTQISVAGSVGDLFASPDATLEVAANAKSVNALGNLVGQGLGRTGPLRLSARLSGRAPKLQIANLSVELDKSDVHGTLTVDLDTSPTTLRGDLASKRLDLQSLVGGRGNAFTDEDKLPLNALRDAELHIRLTADTVILANSTIGPASVGVDLKDGRLALSDIDIKMLGGTISSGAVVMEKDSTASSGLLASVKLQLLAQKLDLAKLLTEGVTAPGDNLQVDVNVAVDSEGRTLNQLLANLSGEASVFSNGGKISGSGLNQLVLDFNPLRLLPPLWGSTEVVSVACLAGIADIKQGISSTHLVLDTQRMTLLGEGTVNLRERQIDLTLKPTPKSKLPSATGVPVHIIGPLDSPTVDPLATKAVGGLFKGLFRSLTIPLDRIARVFGEKARDACASAIPR